MQERATASHDTQTIFLKQCAIFLTLVYICICYKKTFPKMWMDIEMAVPKQQKLDVRIAVCRQDGAFKDYSSSPIFFYT